MRVIVTGGSGLIGKALSASLASDGHSVIVLSRNPHRASDLPDGVQVLGWDGRSADGWEHVADGSGAIVNLAGESLAAGRWTQERKRRIRDSRVRAGQAVVQAVAAVVEKPKVVVQASGIGYYGPRADEEITETAPVGGDFLSQVCIDWEGATAPIDEMGIRRPVIRMAAVLSTDGGALPRLLLPFKLFAGGQLGSGRQWFPWIHIADVVGAVRFLVQHPDATGPFNLTAPNPVTNKEFSQLLGRALKRPAFLPAPGFALRLALGEMATVLLDGQRAMPRRLMDLGFVFRFSEPDAALSDLLG